jgi:3-hydroxy-9,10-secoandrosta-1,3,5(10)-triene-9,17-dione monooxygenase
MQHEVLDRIEEIGGQLEEEAAEAERLGRLPDKTAKLLRSTGVVRMLQPRGCGGYECDPRDFFESVIATATHCGASGWVAGIVGVHPWEMALMPEKLQREIWGEDPDTWIASPYALIGKAKPVEGGYLVSGRWPFSSGTDHCDWIWLGARVLDGEGNPDMNRSGLHVVLPRCDYQIIEDSWDVVGLRGTGSKDVTVDEVFVPEDRTIEVVKVLNGMAAKEAGRSESIYRMPWSAIFPNAITAAVIGACEGALAANMAYQRDRVNHAGGLVRQDPFVLASISEAASEIHSARVQMKDNLGRMWDIVEKGDDVPFALRAQGRRDQVNGSRRSVRALDLVFAQSGGNALRMDKPLQRFWRDAHTGLNHAINTYTSPFQAYATLQMGGEVQAVDAYFI